MDTLDELDPPSEKGQSLSRLQANEEQKRLPTEKTNAVLPSESRYVLLTALETQWSCVQCTRLQIEQSGFEPRPGTLCSWARH